MSIPYAPTSWNPVLGCEPVSEGCKNCWAMKLHNQRHKGYRAYTGFPPQYAEPFSKIQLLPERLSQPLHWRKPRTVAVCFMGDLFHPEVPDEFIYRVFVSMGRAPKHRFLILTKRPARMGDAVRWLEAERQRARDGRTSFYGLDIIGCPWPLPNVWLGVTAENQRMADERIPLLLDTPGKHWLSAEPLLGPIDMHKLMMVHCGTCGGSGNDGPGFGNRCPDCEGRRWVSGLDWVVVGGESGPGHRRMEDEWAADILARCRAAKMPFYFKQRSANRPGQPSGVAALDGAKELPWN